MKRKISIVITMLMTVLSATFLQSGLCVNADNVSYGDIDCNGVCSLNDLLVLNKYLQGQVDLANLNNADVNDNGIISNADYSILLDYMLGAVTVLPYRGN